MCVCVCVCVCGFYFLNKPYLRQINNIGFLTLDPGEGSHVESPGFRVPGMGPWFQILGPGFHFSGMPVADQKARKETPTQVSSCEYCKLFKNSVFAEHLRSLLL